MVVLRPLILALLAAGLLLALLHLWLSDWRQAAVLVSLLLALFFTYGHVYQALEQANFLGRHRFLAPAWLALGILGSWLIVRRGKPLAVQNTARSAFPMTAYEQPTKALNLIALLLLLFPAWQIGQYEFGSRFGAGPALPEAAGLEGLRLPQGQSAPDVYFIILDEYTRQDLLQQEFGFDNDAFLDGLEELGFAVIPCSQSNYAQTEMALASTLNMDYLENLGLSAEAAPDEIDRTYLHHLIKDSLVEQAFRSLGYSLAAFETGFGFSEFTDAEVYYTVESKRGWLYRAGLAGGMNAFEAMLLRSTAGLFLMDISNVIPGFPAPELEQSLDEKRAQVLYDLEVLSTRPQKTAAPRLVFAHILLPHEPFVFDAQGGAANYSEGLSESAYVQAYSQQVAFLNDRLLPLLRTIIETSATPPIIILQGDTGPGRASHQGRMAILSALYLPGDWSQPLPVGLTPVNNFRLVFDRYFHTQLGLLPDESYFSIYSSPLDFETIANTCAGE